MATYAELLEAASSENLINRVRVAVIVAAEIIRTEADTTNNHAARLVWSKQTFEQPDQEVSRMLWAVLAQNRAATYAQIIEADDATVQVAVDAAVNVFAVA